MIVIRAYDDYGNVVDLVEWEKQIRSEELQRFAQWLWDNHYLNSEAFTIRMVDQYKEQKGVKI